MPIIVPWKVRGHSQLCSCISADNDYCDRIAAHSIFDSGDPGPQRGISSTATALSGAQLVGHTQLSKTSASETGRWTDDVMLGMIDCSKGVDLPN